MLSSVGNANGCLECAANERYKIMSSCCLSRFYSAKTGVVLATNTASSTSHFMSRYSIIVSNNF